MIEKREIIASVDELNLVSEYLYEILDKNCIIFLNGNLASGKTTLVSHIVGTLSLDSSVTSPTFTIQHLYGDNLYHYDLYRIETSDIFSLGIIEEFDKEGWHFIEWGGDTLERFLKSVDYTVVKIDIEPHLHERKYIIEKVS